MKGYGTFFGLYLFPFLTWHIIENTTAIDFLAIWPQPSTNWLYALVIAKYQIVENIILIIIQIFVSSSKYQILKLKIIFCIVKYRYVQIKL